jgi:hypothetical protein
MIPLSLDDIRTLREFARFAQIWGLMLSFPRRGLIRTIPAFVWHADDRRKRRSTLASGGRGGGTGTDADVDVVYRVSHSRRLEAARPQQFLNGKGN